jgi:hypothetical protein
LATVCRSGWAEMTGTRARWQASLMRALNAWLLKALRKRDPVAVRQDSEWCFGIC